MYLDESQIAHVRVELERYRAVLIGLAKDEHTDMNKLDRRDIIRYLELRECPARPDSVPGLMQAFIKSCFTYAILRKFCAKALHGEIPTPETIGECLARVFEYEAFRIEETWLPENLRNAAQAIQMKQQYDLCLNEPRPRMVRVLLDGSDEMRKRLDGGISAFYSMWDRVSQERPEVIWKRVLEFKQPIYNVGPALICDFLKEIGYERFVKVDHHFKKQFPALLVGYDGCKKMSAKDQFILSQDLAGRVGMTPFQLDKILYEWGRYGVYGHSPERATDVD